MGEQDHTPCPSPQILASPTLSAEINAATRSQHVRLNKMILNRLPEALPPQATDPGAFGSGLATFANIFFTFESCWEVFMSSAKTISSERDRTIQDLLLDLRPRSLIRTPRLSNDLQHISGLTSLDLKPVLEPRQKHILDMMIRSITAKPHILLAYGWVMYMAIFSGGRHVRQELSKAGPGFWMGHNDVFGSGGKGIDSLTLPGFSFLSFDDEQGGEEIKMLFKERFREADVILKQDEREDVIQAAQRLFDDCIALVGMLDEATRRRNLGKVMPFFLLFVMGAAIFLIIRCFMLV